MEVTPTQLLNLLREGTAPQKARVAIARNMLPLPPAALVESLDILADDPDAGIQAEAVASLERLPLALARAVAGGQATDARLLGRLARRFAAREEIALDIARNPAASDETLVFLAGGALPSVLEVIGRNQARLERSPEIVAALLANPATPLQVVRLWQEVEERRSFAAPPEAAAAEEEEAAGSHVFEPILVEEEDEAASQAQGLLTGGENELSTRQLSIYAMLKKMSMGQKVALAVKGNREVRNLLIRETNRLLCLKVLENPRVADTDIEAWAKSTNISEDVLRGIATRKEWVAKYSVMKGLVNNPRAPIGVTLDFIKRLSLKDLDQLAKNRNVPETLRSSARRLHQLKRDRA